MLPGSDPGLLPYLAIFLLAGVVKGMMGLGLPTVSMALLGLMMIPAEAAAFVLVPTLVTNLLQLQPWSTLWRVIKRFRWMQVGVVAGTLGAAAVFGAPAGVWATVALGSVLFLYAVWGLAGLAPRIPEKWERAAAFPVGMVSGVIGAVTGMFFIPSIPFLQALDLRRDELMQSMALTFCVSMLALAVGLYSTSYFTAQTAATSAIMLFPAIVGMYAGRVVQRRLSTGVFRLVFFLGLAMLGIYIVVRQIH